jgi:hypothetical protein
MKSSHFPISSRQVAFLESDREGRQRSCESTLLSAGPISSLMLRTNTLRRASAIDPGGERQDHSPVRSGSAASPTCPHRGTTAQYAVANKGVVKPFLGVSG